MTGGGGGGPGQRDERGHQAALRPFRGRASVHSRLDSYTVFSKRRLRVFFILSAKLERAPSTC